MIFDLSGRNKAEPFFVEYEQTYIHGNTLSTEKTQAPDVLFLHGEAPTEDRNVFWLLRQILLDQYGISSCAFDFVGHGTTGGQWDDSCLNARTEQAAIVVNACFDSQPLTVVANGMGAYTALKLVEMFSIDSLVLISPKVYAVEVYHSRLGGLEVGASKCLDHWDKTDAWSVIQRFKGRVSIVGTNKSDPLCPGTMSRLYSHATRSVSRQAFELSGAEQSSELLAYCDHTPTELKRLVGIIDQACGSNKVKEQVSVTL